jgi:hypothetical protein
MSLALGGLAFKTLADKGLALANWSSSGGGGGGTTPGLPIQWINNSGQVVVWTFSSGYALYKSDAQQYGKYIGLTLTSNSTGTYVINTFELEHELRTRF